MELTYELAKELKDAGFPQGLQQGDWAWNENGGCVLIHNSIVLAVLAQLGEWVLCPTLEELVEACGDKVFECVINAYRNPPEKRWCAKSWLSKEEEWGYGSTSTEAVARLWLALYGSKRNT